MSEFSREWEKISEDTYRLKVPGGWIVKAIYGIVSVAMIFVPDIEVKEAYTEHGWQYTSQWKLMK